MSLLCRLGWHRPERLPRWHDGLYFSKCLRCGRDLVRTQVGGWRTLTDYRIDWREPEPPEPEPASPLLQAPSLLGHLPPEPAEETIAPEIAQIPLAAMAEPADAHEPSAPEATSVPASPDVRARPRSVGPMADFMFDEAEENRSEFPETARQGPRPAMVSARRAADRPSLWTGAALAGAGAAAGAAMAVLILSSQVAFRSVPPGAPPAIAVAAVPPTPSPAAALHGADFMVAERSVRCNPGRRHRETGAPPGQEIRLLTGDGHWISLTRPGTRCWTLRAGARSVAVR